MAVRIDDGNATIGTLNPVLPQPEPWDPKCPACLSGFGPNPDPNDPTVVVAYAYPIDGSVVAKEG
jgi:hypothetical protein